MRSILPDARDQGARPTCLAFAVSDAHMLAARRNELLSPEYLHFHAARRSGVGLSAGVGVVRIREALSVEGQPSEMECPYSDARDESWVPPSGLTAIWTRGSRLRNGTPSAVLEAALLAKRAHVLVLRISRSFHLPDSTSHMIVEDGGKDGRLHAVLVIGMAPIGDALAFVARNSWGPAWGIEGHAWLPSQYVDSRAVDIIEIEQEADQA